MLLMDIPFYRQVVVMSFECPHCGFKNNELQDTNKLAEFGEKTTLKVTCRDDLERSIVRGKFAVTFIPELELEVPATNKGYSSTLEGFLMSFKEDLQLGQEQRREQSTLLADQIDTFIQKLDKYIVADPEILPFTYILDDPSGLSYIQNLKVPNPDPQLKHERYNRTKEQIIVNCCSNKGYGF